MRKPSIKEAKKATKDFRAAIVRARKIETRAWARRKKRHFAQLKRVRTWDEARQLCSAVGVWKPIIDSAIRKWIKLSATMRQLHRVWVFATANEEGAMATAAAEAMFASKLEQAASMKEAATLLRDVEDCSKMLATPAAHKNTAIEKLFSFCNTTDDLELVASELRRIRMAYILDKSSMYHQFYSRLLVRLGEPIDTRAIQDG